MLTVLLFPAVLLCMPLIGGMNLAMKIDLRGEWKFEIGDNYDYAKPDFNDTKWSKIQVPSLWENEGFPGYNGFAWYRISFFLPGEAPKDHLYLKLGRIDDVDEVFLNGNFLGGTGKLPPTYETAYDQIRQYRIPIHFLKYGQHNVIAVRVFDIGGGGGIYDGEIGLFERMDILELEMALDGNWYFQPGDNEQWKRPEFDHSEWAQIHVPGYWDDHGYRDLDGIAWYRRQLVVPESLTKQKLILMLGKINDNDEVFFNGHPIGSWGEIPGGSKRPKDLGFRYKERAYFIPGYLINPGKTNTIAVRVYDISNKGGIYQGPIGITTRENFMNYQRKRK